MGVSQIVPPISWPLNKRKNDENDEISHGLFDERFSMSAILIQDPRSVPAIFFAAWWFLSRKNRSIVCQSPAVNPQIWSYTRLDIWAMAILEFKWRYNS